MTSSSPSLFEFSNDVTSADKKVITGVFADRFTPLKFSASCDTYGDRAIHYRLYEPATVKRFPHPNRRDVAYPRIVWLHGFGDGGSNNNQSQIRWLKRFLFDTGLADQYSFYFLAVQCPPDDRYWTNSRSSINPDQIQDMADICKLITDETIADFPIDPDRVYLMGLSSGGTGAWNMAGKYPETFAAVVPISSTAGDQKMLANIGSVPVWAFGNQDDEVAPPEAVIQNVSIVNEHGGNAHFTVFEDAGHIAYPFRYSELEFGDWLFSKRRGDFAWWLPPGSRRSQWPLGAIVKFVWPGFRIHLLIAATLCLIGVRWIASRKRKRENYCSLSADDAKI